MSCYGRLSTLVIHSSQLLALKNHNSFDLMNKITKFVESPPDFLSNFT